MSLEPARDPSTEERKFPRGLVVRLFAYLVAGHLFAAFLYLLFVLGGQNQ
ncbi:DUF6126 family protein [Streptomyces sp. LP05-1]|uniref:DUF6126 family protein n=1 Tax=Streptomyces pyxinae TaxID=2970734 RepID=A0ABT2CKV1_9ACTN|nr:DUF6126 family protein [Streptomyces sp. LP05-1]MCS0638032.1 DUF6126 family protein [Streptomyces sp. LP05-1]